VPQNSLLIQRRGFHKFSGLSDFRMAIKPAIWDLLRIFFEAFCQYLAVRSPSIWRAAARRARNRMFEAFLRWFSKKLAPMGQFMEERPFHAGPTDLSGR